MKFFESVKNKLNLVSTDVLKVRCDAAWDAMDQAEKGFHEGTVTAEQLADARLAYYAASRKVERRKKTKSVAKTAGAAAAVVATIAGLKNLASNNEAAESEVPEIRVKIQKED